MMLKKRLAAGLTALCFIAGAVCEPVAELGLSAFGNDVVASADRVDGFSYKSEDIFVADSMLQQATLPDGTKYFQHNRLCGIPRTFLSAFYVKFVSGYRLKFRCVLSIVLSI